MNNNIFVKKKKYNPDIVVNYSKIVNERENKKFEYTNEFHESEKPLSSQVGLSEKYTKDEKQIDMDKLINSKMEERKNQEFDLKPSKNFIPSSNPNEFKEYNDLKNQQNKFEEKIKSKNSSFDNILSDLKDLGILKK